jgi:Tfp pilus assembly protein PilX
MSDDVELTYRQRRAMLRFVVLMLLAIVLLFGMVILTSYQSRSDQAKASRAGCERSKLDRRANARAWREAQKARTRDGDLGTAAIYKGVADGLVVRSKIVCKDLFPDPPVLKFTQDR